jgi:hypothetical protein
MLRFLRTGNFFVRAKKHRTNDCMDAGAKVMSGAIAELTPHTKNNYMERYINRGKSTFSEMSYINWLKL